MNYYFKYRNFLRKRSHQEDSRQIKFQDSFRFVSESITPGNQNILNPKIERKGYLKHIKNLRLAHKIQLKNEKFLTMTKLEEIIAQKLSAYEESISKVFEKFIKQFYSLNK